MQITQDLQIIINEILPDPPGTQNSLKRRLIHHIEKELAKLLGAEKDEISLLRRVLNSVEQTGININERLDKIMSAISDFAAKQNAFNDRQDAAVEGLTTDVNALKAEIQKLQNSPGTITPEDQASLDSLQARAEGIATKLEALDALTPPTPPAA